MAFLVMNISNTVSLSLSRAHTTGKVGSWSGAFVGNGGIKMVQCAGSRSIRANNTKVSMTAKGEEELVEIRNMSEEDINTTVLDLKGELFLLRSKQALRQEFKSSEFKRLRKRVARMLTIKREREIEKGILPRESRKLDKAWKRNAVIRPAPSLVAQLQKSKDKE